MESTETSRDKKKLVDAAGFMFTFHALSADSTKFWRCVIRSCRYQLHTDVHDIIMNRLRHHTHESDAASVEVAKIKANIKLEPWIQWNCRHRFTIKSWDPLTRLLKDKCLGIRRPESWFNAHAPRTKHPCQRLQISQSLLCQTSTNSTSLRPMLTNYSYSEIVAKPIPITWWFLNRTAIATGRRTWIEFS